jgi:phosphohistidine phosphatase
MRRLFLLRHAKSSWDDSELLDHDRPLAPRGRRAMELLAEHLVRERVLPTLVLCSSAQRTRETLEWIAPALGEGISVRIEDELYAASELRLFERLRAVEVGVESLMLIGHNPGLEQLALSLAGRSVTPARSRADASTGGEVAASR